MTTQEGDPHRLLVGAVGFMQSQGVRNYLMDTGVGGAMLGALVDKYGISWLPDVTYHIIDSLSHAVPVDDPDDPHDPLPGDGPLDGQPERVSCAVRNGIGYVLSSYHPGQILVLEQYGLSGSSDESPQAMIEHLSLGDHSFFVLISSCTGDMLIVDRRREKEEYITVWPNGTICYSEGVVNFFTASRGPGRPSRVIFLSERMLHTPSRIVSASEREPNVDEIRRSENGEVTARLKAALVDTRMELETVCGRFDPRVLAFMVVRMTDWLYVSPPPKENLLQRNHGIYGSPLLMRMLPAGSLCAPGWPLVISNPPIEGMVSALVRRAAELGACEHALSLARTGLERRTG